MPTVDDLTEIAKGALERAYTQEGTRRPRCSREDFTAGWIAALVWNRSWSSFKTRPEVER
jgi:hypothetical protein